MWKLNKVYYYSLEELLNSVPFAKLGITGFLATIFNLDDTSNLSLYQLPDTLLSTDTSIYNELFTLVYGRYCDEAILRFNKKPYEAEPTQDEINEAFNKWGYKFVSLLNMTYEYYLPLLKFYRTAKADLMADIVATSSNSVKFNDTPQNKNADNVYEGDDYITHFTKTDNTSSSPLNSKIMRLKEIQDHYKNVMADWVKEFEKLFMEIN